MSDEKKDENERFELHEAFSGAYGALEREAAALRRQVERQTSALTNFASRERVFRKLIEDQFQLIRSREGQSERDAASGEVLTIPVRQAMGLADEARAASAGSAAGLDDWLAAGGETDALQRPAPAGAPADDAAAPGALYLTLRRPPSQAWRASPGLAAFSLPRGELRTLGFNLVGAADGQLDHLAEEIAQSVALNRRFAPVIFTTTRAGLNSFRSRRLTYESLPVFSDTIARISGIPDARSFYDLRIGFLVRKWRIQGVMNLGRGYEYVG